VQAFCVTAALTRTRFLADVRPRIPFTSIAKGRITLPPSRHRALTGPKPCPPATDATRTGPARLAFFHTRGPDRPPVAIGRVRERRRAHNLVELCVEPGGSRIGQARQRLITVLVDEPS
jgi:hypothetical protein